MPNPFLEELLPTDILYGSRYTDSYVVEIARTAGGQEHRRLVHPFPERRFVVSYVKDKGGIYDNIQALYHRAYGTFAGFRARAIDDHTTSGLADSPTAFDQLLDVVTAGTVYQLVKDYGTGGTPIAIGLPKRTIFKPVSGSVVVGIRNTITGDSAITAFSVDTTTGQVTLSANKTRSITAITQATSAVLTVGSHTFIVGDSVHVSGVSGMTEINGRRAAVTAFDATKITVAINSSAFSAYTSGGTANTIIQSGETLRGGCRFDIPCRFGGALDITPVSRDFRETGEIEIVELITP
jgi:uncharacterized protein (TIGR02217 family)